MSVYDRHLTTILPPVSQEHGFAGGMSILEAFRVALQGLAANKMRAFLTMLGIIIGVGSVIIMVALGQGVANATAESIKKLGTNVLTVSPNSQQRGGVSQGLGSQQNLKLEDVDFIKRLCPDVQSVSPQYRGTAQAQFGNQNTRTTIMGADANYFDIRNLPIAEGRALTDQDLKRKMKVAVVGDNVRQTVFGDVDPIGKTVKINGQNFTVVGLTTPRGGTAFRNPDDQITIPVTTAMRRVFGVEYLNAIDAQAVSDKAMGAAQDELLAAMHTAHKLRADEDPDVKIFNQQDIMDSAQQQSTFLTMLLAGIALVSLIVGGIGIMNIMLVSVTERTREIGIRKAIGAQRKDILYQFLIESVTLSVAGGIIGIILGVGGSVWAALPQGVGLGFPMALSLAPMVVAFVFSALVGVFFGIYPAMKASALDPIVALRYE